MITRSVRGRRFRLLPSRRTKQIVSYVLAVMSKRWNVRVHAACVLGNHWHAVVTDPDGNIVEFTRDCHHFIARGINAQYGDDDTLWDSQQTSRVECEEPNDTVAKIAYAMANPVEARLVRRGSRWPGLRRAWPAKPRTIKKPPRYFRGADKGGNWPSEAVLEFSRPPGYDELSDDELAAVIATAITKREEKFRREYEAAKLPFLGRKNVLAQSRWDRPRGERKRSDFSPRVACRNKWRRIERLAANKRWLDAYRHALKQWRAGDRDVEFPAGTYKMQVLHGVRCAAPPV